MSDRPIRARKDLRNIVYPFLFILSEGKTINNNPLDFKLTMFHMTSKEQIRSPTMPYCIKKR